MKASDFKELQEFCEQKGYQLLNESLEDNTKFFVVAKKKDEWEGCEFVLCTHTGSPVKGKILRVISIDPTSFDICVEGEKRTIWSRYGFLPSTEQAYKAQLEKIAFEKYGEIKEGDRFDFSNTGNHPEVKNFKILPFKKKIFSEFEYVKSTDSLLYWGYALYDSGKWATRVPERVKVKFNYHGVYQEDQPCETNDFNFTFHKKPSKIDFMKAGEFLASCLESYLNGETPNPPKP